MHDGGDGHRGSNEEHESGVQRVEAGEELAAVGAGRVHRSHPSEQHSRVEEGVAPGKVLEMSITSHPHPQRRCDQCAGPGKVQQETAAEMVP